MNKFARLMPYVWPSRHKLFVSFGFAALVALLWGGNLATVFPIVKVLLEGESLQQYVQREMKDASGERDYYETEVHALDAQLAQATEADRLELMQKKVRLESKIASVSTIVARFQWVSVYLLPWMPEDQFDTFAMILGGFMVMTLLKLAACFVEEILVGSVVQLTIMRIRKALFRKVLSLDYQTLTRKGTPDLMSRFTYDVETLAQGLNLLAGNGGADACDHQRHDDRVSRQIGTGFGLEGHAPAGQEHRRHEQGEHRGHGPHRTLAGRRAQ